jgi:hypothetical protein
MDGGGAVGALNAVVGRDQGRVVRSRGSRVYEGCTLQRDMMKSCPERSSQRVVAIQIARIIKSLGGRAGAERRRVNSGSRPGCFALSGASRSGVDETGRKMRLRDAVLAARRILSRRKSAKWACGIATEVAPGLFIRDCQIVLRGARATCHVRGCRPHQPNVSSARDRKAEIERENIEVEICGKIGNSTSRPSFYPSLDLLRRKARNTFSIACYQMRKMLSSLNSRLIFILAQA